MLDSGEIIGRLKLVKEMGYVRTHRSGPTGIGKTLEDLLGIEENNFEGPDGKEVELKSSRIHSGSMVTLFTKAPGPDNANSQLLEGYGYCEGRIGGKKVLHSTVNALAFNMLRGAPGFKIVTMPDRIECVDSTGKVVGVWTRETLKKSFERKLPRLMYVKADARGKGKDEEFWFKEAYLLSGFSFESFLSLMEKGKILVDIRIGQYPDGRPHDHGTGFRVFPDKFDLCFSQREQVV